MQRGLQFKVMTPKDISNVVGKIVGNPAAVTSENIEKPTLDTASKIYQSLAEFAYDMDINQIKALAPEVEGVHPHPEIFDEGMDTIAMYKLCRQLASINRIEDFNMKDIWDPQAKRLRPIVSGIINFCRYKETQTSIIGEMKDKLQDLNDSRAGLVGNFDAISQELVEAQTQHNAELQDMCEAEKVLSESQGVVTKLEKQKEVADRVLQSAESKLNVVKERYSQKEQRAKLLRESIQSLEEQVAESPEGIEHEIQELRMLIDQQKQQVEEKSDEKRSGLQRVQALGKVKKSLNEYKETLEQVEQSATAGVAARARSAKAQADLDGVTSCLDSRRTEEAEMIKAAEQINADMDADKQAHEQQLREFEERRQQAMVQFQDLQGKRTEEQQQWSDLLAQREALELEIANTRRQQEIKMCDLQNHLDCIQQNGSQYVNMINGLTSQSDAEAGRLPSLDVIKAGKKLPMGSPGSVRSSKSPGSRRGSFSHSPGGPKALTPRRLMMSGGYVA